MRKIPAKVDYLAGKHEGLEEAVRLVQHAIDYGVPLERVLVDLLEFADRVDVERTMDFDEAAFAYVPRAG
jgi:hypothetical protein